MCLCFMFAHRKADVKPVMSPRREEYYSHAHSEETFAGGANASISGNISTSVSNGNLSKAAPSTVSNTASTTSTTPSNAPTATLANAPTGATGPTAEEDAISLDCDTDSTGDPGGNLLVEAATEADADAAEECLTQTDMCKQGGESGDGGVGDSERAREQAAYKHSIRIRPIDIIRVPKYDRVWEIGSMGQVSIDL